MTEVTIDAEATEAFAERLFQAALETVDILVCGLRLHGRFRRAARR